VGLLDGLKRELAHRPDLWFFAIFFGWISLLFAFAGGALPSLLTRLAGGNVSAAATFTDVLYPVLVNGTFLYSPAIGYAIDRFGFKVIFVACLMLAQAFALLLLVPSLAAQLLTFIVYALAQACLYALQFAYISKSCSAMVLQGWMASNSVDPC
jgi:MFS family permease